MDNSDNVTARYTHGPGIDEPLIVQRGGQSYYYVTDGLGSVIKIVDSVGNVINSYVYDSFGNVAQKTETVTNSHTYTAREFDAESGLYYYRNRYYDANIGRFISADKNPGNIWQPMIFNKYLYTHNNPINWIDPYGFESECPGSNTGNNTDNNSDAESNDPKPKPELPKLSNSDNKKTGNETIDTINQIIEDKGICWDNICATVDIVPQGSNTEFRGGIKFKW